jgi:Pyruvate/2-oxoglutarate dehydrogenase complex, dihydrolipoamide acyltransferase (E2) component, and related enzymes
MVDARQSSKDTFLEKYGVKLTYTPIIMDACIKAIKDFPLINTSLDGDKIIHHDNINLGVAVALPDNNLIVPVVKSSEEKNIIGLARSSADLAIRARNNSLEANEIFGSTFTVTNPGIFGSLFGMAIINQPNVAILSVGAITKKPVVKETEYGDVVVIRSMLYLTLGYDHRIIDGAYGTQFLARIVSELENFDINEIK